MTIVQPSGGGVSGHGSSSGLADVIDTILDKGLVIDAYVRVSLVGIEVLTVDARVVVASVDTYLRFAEAVNRLDLSQTGNQKGLPELVEGMTESGSKKKVKGATQGLLDAAGEKIRGLTAGESGEDEFEEAGEEREPAPRRRRRREE
ncbi:MULTISPECIES: gas vesicle protein GvpJ [unclassified Streptosporangium]|uniref:gas vesicle protein GvpJ n=1 Tax=unclassified Streptosporangium TaxID=2632669 RepID=UPI002E2AF52C|nr:MULTISPECIES: gas vesicle protein GvpJ [unclassified Streptosporangium]